MKRKIFIKRLKSFMAFALGRRASMWLHFKIYSPQIVIFWLFRLFYRRHIYFRLDKSGVDLFAFRDPAALKKFMLASELNFQDHGMQKNRLLGEALGYPEVAIDDFCKLSEVGVRAGDRLLFSSADYGYDGFVFKPEHLPEILIWAEENRIPRNKIIIKSNASGKWEEIDF